MAAAGGATVKLYGVGRALRSNSEYARRMKFLSSSIFGDVMLLHHYSPFSKLQLFPCFFQVKRPTTQDGLRVVQIFARQPFEQRKEIAQVT